jgi:hypothetical protein
LLNWCGIPVHKLADDADMAAAKQCFGHHRAVANPRARVRTGARLQRRAITRHQHLRSRAAHGVHQRLLRRRQMQGDVVEFCAPFDRHLVLLLLQPCSDVGRWRQRLSIARHQQPQRDASMGWQRHPVQQRALRIAGSSVQRTDLWPLAIGKPLWPCASLVATGDNLRWCLQRHHRQGVIDLQ